MGFAIPSWMRLRGEHTRRVCQLYWYIKRLAGSKQPEAKLTPSEFEIVSVLPGFSLFVEHASSVWQEMKIYVRISKLPEKMQMEHMPSI